MKANIIAWAILGVLLRLAAASPALAAGAEQDFADDKAYKIESFNGGANLQVERLKDKGPTGKQALAIKFDSPRENSGVRLSWDVPADVLDGKTFVFHLRKGRLPYVRASFQAGGKQVFRHNYFTVGGDNWQKVSFAYGMKGTAASTEPATVTPGQKIDRIVIQLCGKADKSYEVEISEFALAKEAGAVPAPEKAIAGGGGKPSAGPSQAFDMEGTYAIKPFYGAADMRVTALEKPGPTGRPALDLQADCPRDNAGVQVEWTFPPNVLDDKTFSLQVRTPSGAITYVRAEFLDAGGKRVSRSNYFSVAAADWRPLTFAVRGKSGAASVEPAQPAPGQQVAAIRLQFCGQAGKRVHALISDFAATGESRVQRVQPPTGEATLSSGDLRIWLGPARAYTLTAVQIGDQRFERSNATPYPSFTFLDAGGQQITMAADDPGFTVKAETRAKDKTTVRYSRDGTTVEVVYAITGEAVRCDVTVIDEGSLKLVAVGAAKLLGAELAPDDYGILPNGYLYRRLEGGPPRSFRRLGNADNAVTNFVAAKLGKRIVFYKPLTASQEMHLAAETAEKTELIWFGGQLFFRPSKVMNPATSLCHRTLAWRLETAGDQNQDGDVD